MRLTVGMACYDDFHGVYFTARHLRLFHGPEVAEIVVVDNHPDGPHGEQTKVFCQTAGVRYVPMGGANGTAGPRDRVFAEATGDVVLCCDSHVLFKPGALAALRSHFERHPDCDDLVQGPMLYDDGTNLSTHFDLTKWDGEMWGQWATVPDWAGRERAGEPFDVPAQGLGAFACRKAAWLGFNPRFRGFGGEEGYIHEKYRLAGRRCLCLPALQWAHRFGRPDGVRYPLAREDKVRNTCIGLAELGLDPTPHKAYWVGRLGVREADWDALMATGEYPERPAAAAGCSSCAGQPLRPQPPADVTTLAGLFDWVASQPRDLDQHAGRVKGWAAKAGRVTAFVKRREWNVLLAAARPARLVVYQGEGDPLLDRVHAAVLAANRAEPDPHEYTTHVGGAGSDSLAVEIDPCDLLVIDTVHHADRLYAELSRHGPKVAGRILLRGTGAFGEQAEGGGPGLLPAVRRFVGEHPEWTVVEHTPDQYGMTVLSKLEEDKKPLPSLWRQGVNAAKASWRAGANVLTGFGPLNDTDAQDGRLALCLLCPSHRDGRCAECGCPVDKKTSWPSEFCPLGKWPASPPAAIVATGGAHAG